MEPTATFYLRPLADGRVAFRLVVRDATASEDATTPHGAEGVLEIYPRGARKPALTVVVGAPACRVAGYTENQARDVVCAGLAFASEPSCWDDPAEREASEDVGRGAADAAWSHRTIARWIDGGR